MIIELYDTQCLNNVFVYSGYSTTEDKYYQFIINEKQNDFDKLYEHLFRSKEYTQVGFDCIINSYPILVYIIENNMSFKEMSGSSIADNLFRFFNKFIIDESAKKETLYCDKIITQIDLARIWDFTNKDRPISLEDVKFNLRFKDLSYPYFDRNTAFINTEEKLQKLLIYSQNNVEAIRLLLNDTLGNTNNPLYKGRNKILVRDILSEKYNCDFTNLNNKQIVNSILLKEYCILEKTNREQIHKKIQEKHFVSLSECISDEIHFDDEDFRKAFDHIKTLDINLNNKLFSLFIEKPYFTIKFDLKGIQGCVDPGVFEEEGYNIVMMDVKSMFPSIMKNLEILPSHLNSSFLQIYGDLVDLRLSSMSNEHKNEELADLLKQGLNPIWGKLGNTSEWVYDPVAQYKVSFMGQMFMCLFMEKLNNIEGVDFLFVNTDCVCIKIKSTQLTLAKRVCDYMYEFSGLQIRFDMYDKITILDGNNYLLEDIFDCYGKGCFNCDNDYYKNTSKIIGIIALKEYFRNGMLIKDTIINHKDIYDFCIKTKTPSTFTRSYSCKNQYGEHFCMIMSEDMPEPDYDYYIKAPSLVVSKITQKQQKLF